MAFNAKNLSYDKQEPAFLRRLKGERVGDRDRQERPIARPKRLKGEDEDDGPTYVVEDSGDTLSKEEYEKLVAGKGEDGEAKEDGEGKDDDAKEAGEGEKGVLKGKQKVAEIGAPSRKRKAVKVGGADEDDDAAPAKEAKAKKPKKKTKAVKLSFGDEENT